MHPKILKSVSQSTVMSSRSSFPFPNQVALISPLKQQQLQLLFSPRRVVQFSRSVERLCKSTTTSAKSRHFAVIRCGGPQIVQGEIRSDGQFDDGYYMRRCVELAKKAIGCTSPNPMVGCVIVNDGQVVGEGYHPKAGQPHAEVFALRDAGNKAENGTAYVSLEPCNHYGRTPPCTEALIKAKVRKVVVGMVDPNPIVASAGIKKLQDAGIEVTVRVEEEMCKRLNEAYIHRMLTGKPFVTLRYSMSLNGHLLDQLSEEATEIGGYYSKLLQEYDAVILSSKALSDTPSLPMSREPGANEPLKIVLLNNQTSLTSIPALSTDVTSNVLIISEKGRSLEPQSDQERIQILSLDRISLSAILERCHGLGFCSVLIDLMGEDLYYQYLLKEGFEEKLFQKVIVEVLPLLGGRGENILNHMYLNAKVKNLHSSVVGKSLVLEGYF